MLTVLCPFKVKAHKMQDAVVAVDASLASRLQDYVALKLQWMNALFRSAYI